jgi:hypothetical protein
LTKNRSEILNGFNGLIDENAVTRAKINTPDCAAKKIKKKMKRGVENLEKLQSF